MKMRVSESLFHPSDGYRDESCESCGPGALHFRLPSIFMLVFWGVVGYLM